MSDENQRAEVHPKSWTELTVQFVMPLRPPCLLLRFLLRAFQAVGIESIAGLEPQKGGLWHPLRRKWAMERKGLELRDVAYAGGWTEPTTLLRVYQKPDTEMLERVVVQRKTLRHA
jgi:hypothetical protein